MIKKYDALIEPEPELWLELSEDERISLIENYIEKNETNIKKEVLIIHSSIHMFVENQLAENFESTKEAYNRLIRQGLNRHDTLHAIGSIVTNDIYNMVKNETEFNDITYKNRLRKLTAKKWKKRKG